MKQAESRDNVDLSDVAFYGFDKVELKLSVFPNPANDKIYVTAYSPNSEKKISLGIYSAMGDKIAEKEVLLNRTFELMVSGFNSGIYFLRAEQISDVMNIPAVVKWFVIDR
jgi:hypothetical protein